MDHEGYEMVPFRGYAVEWGSKGPEGHLVDKSTLIHGLDELAGNGIYIGFNEAGDVVGKVDMVQVNHAGIIIQGQIMRVLVDKGSPALAFSGSTMSMDEKKMLLEVTVDTVGWIYKDNR